MSMWHPSMYGVGPDCGHNSTLPNPANPIGPDVKVQNDWWFRGPESRALKPQKDSVMTLPAGGKVEIEIACNVAFTSYGVAPSNRSDPLAACPGNSGAFHSGVPDEAVDDRLLSGCALAIADKDNIEEVGWDDLVVFSVNQRCVRDRVTTFEIPDQLPKCTGDKCICGWFWLANNGTGNFYMTGFDCSVEPTPRSAPILPPVDPEFCPSTNSTCSPTKGAKRPIYAYNSPSNVVWQGNDNRPGYHDSWSFFDGAQNDIFELEEDETASKSTSNSSLVSTSGARLTQTATSSTRQSALSTKTSLFRPSSVQAGSSTSSSSLNWTVVSTSSSSPTSHTPLSSPTPLLESSTRRNGSSTTSAVPTNSTASLPANPSIGQALKLVVPVFDSDRLQILKRQHHLPFSHHRSKRNFITDELLDQTQSTSSGGGRTTPLSLGFVPTAFSLALALL
ncbi:uncharacterized protein JCM6883_002690 [Sporobolomyces salmoneus]|uniref:uncharacterized protein n=1 Tax=Sporobolomyces salmoneus TaxID=183962 RepID=UPI003174EC72